MQRELTPEFKIKALKDETPLGAHVAGRSHFLRVSAFTGSLTISSARFRVRQYIPGLREYGVAVEEEVARFGSWPPLEGWKRPAWLIATLAQRVPGVIRSYNRDVTLLQREMVSTLKTLEGITKAPRVFDVDDAVWLNGSGRQFREIVEKCEALICGNDFIANEASRWHKNVFVVPTAVDTDRYSPKPTAGRRIIGWSGLAVGQRWVNDIEPALAEVLRLHNEVVLRIVSERAPKFRTLPPERVEYIQWSPEVEVSTIQEMTVGIMPLEDSLQARGKCSYKMLLYMSCGVPVVVTPVGMNSEVLAQGEVGRGATTHSEWVEHLSWLLNNPESARNMGLAGRKIIEENYSLRALTPKIASILWSVSGK